MIVAGFVLAGLGLVLASLFTLAYYRVVPRTWLAIPVVCDLRGHSCGNVLDSPYARTLGPPNSAFGILFYALWIGWLALGAPLAWTLWVVLATGAAFFMSLYLAWALLAKMKVVCRLCFAGHGINTGLLVVSLWRMA